MFTILRFSVGLADIFFAASILVSDSLYLKYASFTSCLILSSVSECSTSSAADISIRLLLLYVL
ncbi:hypothetical protein CS542_02855 [Pedobacter sp. IW39]|nr:hypothetical protein CS542_02855 [Pedobacter sp. IW39]